MIAPLPAAAQPSSRPPSLRAELGRLIDQHGPARIATALLVVLATRPRRRVDAADLGPHLRRDVGLPPAAPRPGYWRHL